MKKKYLIILIILIVILCGIGVSLFWVFQEKEETPVLKKKKKLTEQGIHLVNKENFTKDKNTKDKIIWLNKR